MTDPKLIWVRFPYPGIATIRGKRAFENIEMAHCELNSNSASISSNLGNGLFGHFFLMVTMEIYLNQARVN